MTVQVFIDGEIANRSINPVDIQKEIHQLQLGDEVELYEFSGGHILAKVIAIDGNEIYTKKISSHPCF